MGVARYAMLVLHRMAPLLETVFLKRLEVVAVEHQGGVGTVTQQSPANREGQVGKKVLLLVRQV